MGNILMIIGNLDMTCFGRESGGGTVFKIAAGNIVCYDNMDQMTWLDTMPNLHFLDLNLLWHQSISLSSVWVPFINMQEGRVHDVIHCFNLEKKCVPPY